MLVRGENEGNKGIYEGSTSEMSGNEGERCIWEVIVIGRM